MKYRLGFVSNSSSSSFVCDVCGASESGWDASVSDFDWITCVNEHTVCDSCKLKEDTSEPKQKDEEDVAQFEERHDKWCRETEDGYYSPEECCPICQFIEPSQSDAVKYLLKTYNVPKDEVFAVVKAANKRRRKLYNHEYITYVCQKHNVNLATLLPELRAKFETYEKFEKWLKKV